VGRSLGSARRCLPPAPSGGLERKRGALVRAPLWSIEPTCASLARVLVFVPIQARADRSAQRIVRALDAALVGGQARIQLLCEARFGESFSVTLVGLGQRIGNDAGLGIRTGDIAYEIIIPTVYAYIYFRGAFSEQMCK
jgi:hypothetical protein